MHSVGALKNEVFGIDTAEHAESGHAFEVGIEAAQRHAGDFALVNVEGMKVGIAEGRVESVCGILGCLGEVHETLEHEVDVGVVADDAPVK